MKIIKRVEINDDFFMWMNLVICICLKKKGKKKIRNRYGFEILGKEKEVMNY